MKWTRTLALHPPATAVAAALLLALACGPEDADEEPVRYTLSGSLAILNECDGQQASIPANVMVESSLVGAEYSYRRVTTVALAPDPAAPNAPEKVGTYSLTVELSAGLSEPTHWTGPRVTNVAPRRADRVEICQHIDGCPAGSACERQGQLVRRIGIPAGQTQSTHNIDIDCGCS